MMMNYNKNQKGIALIAVIGVLLVSTVIVTSSMIMSQSVKYSSNVIAYRNQSAYFAESAASRIQWMIVQDKIKYNNRTLITTENPDDEEDERFMANGLIHSINDYYGANITYSIKDIFSGINLDPAKPSNDLKPLLKQFALDEEKREQCEIFINRVKDYTDKDDLLNINGMEAHDYSLIGLQPLPRNNPLQYREELLLIPEYSKFLEKNSNGRFSAINIIPPKGLTLPNKKTNFFAADTDIISQLSSFEEDALQRVIDAKKEWENSKIELAETLEVDEISTLKKNFSFEESGYFTLEIKVSLMKGCTNRTLFVSLKIDKTIKKENMMLYEWELH